MLKPPGSYLLTYHQRLYQLGTTNDITGLMMPSVTVPLDIR